MRNKHKMLKEKMILFPILPRHTQERLQDIFFVLSHEHLKYSILSKNYWKQKINKSEFMIEANNLGSFKV